MIEESIVPRVVACANEDKGADKTEAIDSRLDSGIGELKDSIRAIEGRNSMLDGKVDGL